MPVWASVLPRSRRVGGTRIKGMGRWVNSTSMVLRRHIARIARLQTSLDIVHTSLEIGVNETMEITELSAQKPCALRQWEGRYFEECHSTIKVGSDLYPCANYSTSFSACYACRSLYSIQLLDATNNSESLQPLFGG